MVGLLFTIIILKGYELINRKLIINNLKEVKVFTIMYSVIILSWYMYISGSSLYHLLVDIGMTVINSISTGFLSPEASRGAHILIKQPTGLSIISKNMNLAVIFFMFIGLVKSSWSALKSKFDIIYILLSAYLFGILIAAVALPHFAVMGPDRLYYFASIMLSPFCIIGWMTLVGYSIKIMKSNMKMKNPLKILYLCIIILFLFNTGFIREILQDNPTSRELSQDLILNHGTIEEKGNFYYRFITAYDVCGVEWLGNYHENGVGVYRDIGAEGGNFVIPNYGHVGYVKRLYLETETIKNSYFWLSYVNVMEGIAYNRDEKLGITLPSAFCEYRINSKIKNMDRIYDSSGSLILFAD